MSLVFECWSINADRYPQIRGGPARDQQGARVARGFRIWEYVRHKGDSSWSSRGSVSLPVQGELVLRRILRYRNPKQCS